jgi:hypothetical protein
MLFSEGMPLSLHDVYLQIFLLLLVTSKLVCSPHDILAFATASIRPLKQILIALFPIAEKVLTFLCGIWRSGPGYGVPKM